MKYSIIIPTYNHLDECLRPCIQSILDRTSSVFGGDTEIIVVANGCEDGTEAYLRELAEDIHPIADPGLKYGHRIEKLNLRYIVTPEPLGYTVATNLGLGLARGEFVILMNDDVQILDFSGNDEWIEILRKPFDLDPTVGITGPKKLFCKETGRDFVLFFLAMLRRDTFFKLGYLDESFNPGGGEDIDYCMRLEKAGYRVVSVPEDGPRAKDYVTTFPVYHKGEATVFGVDQWEEKFAARMKLLEARTKRYYYSNFADVTCEISTKGRYFTTLPLALMSVVSQKLKPKRLIIFQDDWNENPIDLRRHSVYQSIFALLTSAGIQWEVVFGEGKGQVLNHQRAVDLATTEWIWRLDDDNYAEPDVLEKLMSQALDGVGAVAGSVIDPRQSYVDSGMSASTAIANINTALNLQWIPGEGVVPADHLYSTFIFRKEAAKHGYCKELSPVGHREETIFTYEMKRAGWTLLIERSAVTWHFREPNGGIRSFDDNSMWSRDEEVFKRKMKEWGVSGKDRLWVNLDCGRGDHWMFRMMLDELLAKHADKVVTLAACYPDAFNDYVPKPGSARLEIVSVADGINALGQEKMNGLNVYGWCMEHGWNRSLVDAFKKIYMETAE